MGRKRDKMIRRREECPSFDKSHFRSLSLPTNLSVESKEGRIRKRKKDRQTRLKIFPASILK